MRRATVAHYTNSRARGGAEEHILTLLRGLDRELFDLTLVCSDQVAALIAADLPHDVRVHRVVLDRPLDLRSARRLAALFRSNVDIVHSHLFYSSLFASPIARLAGVPVVVETPHVRELWRTGLIKSRFFVDRFVGRFVHRYVAVSKANGRYLAETKGLPESKITVIQNGCDIARFKPGRDAPLGLRESLGFGPRDPILVTLGRLEPQKGHEVLLEALAEVVRSRPSTRLVCVGDGSLRSALEARVREMKLASNVRFVGFQERSEDWLALADFSVLPSHWEGLPLAAIESLAAGRTVVASAVDGTVEVVVDGQTGLTVPPGEPAALEQAIMRLLDDDELKVRLAGQGRDWVEGHFSEERQIRETQDLYLSELRRAGRIPGPSSAIAAPSST